MINSEDIIEVQVTNEMLLRTKQLLQTEFVYNRMSVLGGEGNFTGKLAEVVYQHLFPHADRKNTRDYDFIHDEVKVDIKSKTCFVKPQLERNVVSVHTYSLSKQKNDKYVFISIHNSLRKAWIIGSCDKQFFLDNSEFYPEGTIIEENQFKYFKDTNSMPIYLLDKIII